MQYKEINWRYTYWRQIILAKHHLKGQAGSRPVGCVVSAICALYMSSNLPLQLCANWDPYGGMFVCCLSKYSIQQYLYAFVIGFHSIPPISAPPRHILAAVAVVGELYGGFASKWPNGMKNKINKFKM